MTQKAWVRFSGPRASILGRVDVPQDPPVWFKDKLAVLTANMSREATMDDVPPAMYLDALISAGLPIPIYKPLSVQSAPDPTFISKEDFEKVKIEKDGKVIGLDLEKAASCIKRVFTGSQIQGFMEKNPDKTKELIETLVPIQASDLGMPQPEHQVIDPLLDYREDDVTTTRLNPQAFILWVEVKDYDLFNKQAEKAYASQIEEARGNILAGPGSN